MKLLFKDSDLFFEKNKPAFWRDLTQAAVLIIIFSGLTTITFYVGWTAPSANFGSLNAMAWIIASSVPGFFAVTAFLSVIAFRTLRKFKDALFVMAYAATPVLLLGWIPQGFLKILGILWTINFIKVGIEVYGKKSDREAWIIAALTGIATMSLAAATEFYLIYYI